jgi:hypothetical protein
VSDLANQPEWVRLFRIACDLVRQVNSRDLIIDYWTFGGGTALMLQIDHRESHDVDIFLRDPQLLAFLDPQKHDFQFDIRPVDYIGDGSKFLKLAFDIGEIDFIVDEPKTARPAIEQMIEGQSTQLETIPEITTKKIIHRGSMPQPRDIFDVAAASERHSEPIISALRQYKTEVVQAMEALDRLNPDFVREAVAELQIREKFLFLAATALDRTKEILRAV